MPVGDRFGGDPGRYSNGAAASVERGAHSISLQESPDAGPADPRAVGKMAFHAQIRQGIDLLDGLVDVLVALIAARQGELRPLLDVDDNRHGKPRHSRASGRAGGWSA